MEKIEIQLVHVIRTQFLLWKFRHTQNVPSFPFIGETNDPLKACQTDVAFVSCHFNKKKINNDFAKAKTKYCDHKSAREEEKVVDFFVPFKAYNTTKLHSDESVKYQITAQSCF
ncbi:CLUMA_CG021591, isoform A [Clunio marinus]|uniref:CLUMA_CG021591, isoform A n=1 Tax=Clunio marinus TaxID=568069 RepID=A0A1J1J8W6_9DIPT|nr:CLUMA_CG021591, isoform A [Clunio marinus]